MALYKTVKGKTSQIQASILASTCHKKSFFSLINSLMFLKDGAEAKNHSLFQFHPSVITQKSTP